MSSPTSSISASVIIMSKPSALPGDPQSLTAPGVFKSFPETLRIPGSGGARRITSKTSNGTSRAFPRHVGPIPRPHRRGDSEGVSTWQRKQREAPVQVNRFERFTNSSLRLCRRSMTLSRSMSSGSITAAPLPSPPPAGAAGGRGLYCLAAIYIGGGCARESLASLAGCESPPGKA
jgi:hypothetical protein